MKVKTRRSISAYVLLAVFLPMLVLSSLHIHESAGSAETSCMECLHNQCGGHLTQMKTHTLDCVLCQFLTLPLLVAATVGVAVMSSKGVRLYASCHCRLATMACGVISLRGPPACLKG